MLALDARFTLLAALSSLAIQSFSPLSAASAAAIARAPSPDAGSPPAQNFFPYIGSSTHEVRMAHSLNAFSPLVRIADVVFAYATQHQDASTRKSHARRRTNKSIVIPNNRGSDYVISHRRAPPPLWAASQSNRTGTPGTVGIMSSTPGSLEDKYDGYLVLANENGTYILNASDTNKTQLYLVDVSSSTPTNSSTGTQNSNRDIKLCISFTDSQLFCATYNPNPLKAEPLTMQQWFDPASATASQLFKYDPGTSIVRPMWYSGKGDSKSDSTNASDISGSSSTSISQDPTATAASASESASATGSSADSSSTPASLDSRDDAAGTQPARNVTLVFISTQRQAKAADVDTSESTCSAVTTTTTMTVYASSTSSFNPASVTASVTDSASSTDPAATGLNVEVVGGGISSAAPASASESASASMEMVLQSSSTADDTTTAVSTSSADPSTSTSASSSSSSIDAAALASEIASSVSASASASVSTSASASYSATAAADSAVPTSSSSGSAYASSTSSADPGTGTYVAAVMGREAAPAPVMTPYSWKFKREER